MIYDSLRKLPKVIQLDIYRTGDLMLLSDEETPIETLIEIWERLDEDFNERYNKDGSHKVFNLDKEITYQENRLQLIKDTCGSLKIFSNPEAIGLLKSMGYTLSEDNYFEDIERILRESEGIIIKINQLKNSLPKKAEVTADAGSSIIDVMAGYSVILGGMDYDYNTCSVEKFHALEKQAKSKMDAITAQINQQKSRK